jgi:hypothetical protein
MDRHFYYSPTGEKGRTIIFLLTFEKLHHITSWTNRELR